MSEIEKNQIIQRRRLLQNLAITTGIIGFGALAQAQEACKLKTPAQPKGPFYPVADQIDKDADLTQIQGTNRVAQGQVIVVEGVVAGVDCKPIENVFVEIWQACASGRYDHPGDPNTAALDPDFQYWGIVKTNAKGEYSFKTILPGAYPADTDWIRPPHIHFKVHKWGFKELITQLYFEGNELNDKDLILQSLNQEQKELVVRPIVDGVVKFNLTITK